MRHAVILALLPVVCPAGDENVTAPPADTAKVIAMMQAPCTLPNAWLLQFRRLGSMSTFRPADATEQMAVEPGQYTVVMECARVINAKTNTCEELHKRKERIAFDQEILSRKRYIFGCALDGAGKVQFFFRSSNL